MREGFTSNYVKGGVLFAKVSRGGRVVKEIEERGGGSGHNRPSSSPFSRPEQRRGGAASAVPIPAAWGLGGGCEVREKGEGKERTRSPASPRAGVARGGLATAASGGGRRWRCS